MASVGGIHYGCRLPNGVRRLPASWAHIMRRLPEQYGARAPANLSVLRPLSG